MATGEAISCKSEQRKDAPSPAPVRLRLRRRSGRAALDALRQAPLSAWFGLIVLVVYIVVALFAPLIAPYGEADVVSDEAFSAWSPEHWLGTDQLGRDLLSRLLYGARNSMGIALLATALAFSAGSIIGTAAALLRGWFDMAASRLVDAAMAIPTLIFALMVLATIGQPTAIHIIVIIGFVDATRVFRLSRAVAMNVVALDYIEVAILRGERAGWIIFREIMPNIIPTLATEFGLRYCYVFLTISALSFLGLGLQPPTADWGLMVRESASLISYGDITPLIPAVAIAVLTISINFIIDWILDRASGPRHG